MMPQFVKENVKKLKSLDRKEIEPAEIKHPLLYTLHSQTEENCFVLQIIIHRNLPPHVTLPGTDCQYLSCVPSVTPMLTSCQNYLIEILKQNRPSGKNLYEGAKIFFGDEMTKALARRFPADNREKCITAPGPGMVNPLFSVAGFGISGV
jgi:hypothetical protein